MIADTLEAHQELVTCHLAAHVVENRGVGIALIDN